MMDDRAGMRLAIQAAREGIEAGQTPFGTVILCDGQVVAAYNTVLMDVDPTAHAEINAIRRAAARRGTIDLSGCSLFSTCEPCPMCLAASHWARVDRVVYGADIADAAAAGFSELHVGARTLAQLGGSPLQIEGGVLNAECRALFDLWRSRPSARPY